MELLFSQYIIIFILLNILAFLYRKAFRIKTNGILSCGIFGYTGSKPVSIANIKLLGAYNQERGTDSCGFATLEGVEHGVDSEKEWLKFLTKNEIVLSDRSNSIVCHTRRSTMGLKNKLNAHPFHIITDVLNKNNIKFKEYSIFGAHNGVIRNWIKLCQTRDIKIGPIDVDSKGFFTALALDIYNKKYGIFEEYEGVGAFIWISELDPTSMYVFRGESRRTNHLEEIEEERPLFYFETEGGVYFSSMWESLYAIGGDNQTVLSVPANIVFCVKDDKLVEVAKTERATKSFQQFYAPVTPSVSTKKFKNRMGLGSKGSEDDDIIYPELDYYDTEKQERSIDAGESSRYQVNKGNSVYIDKSMENYTQTLNNTIDINNDILPKKLRSKGGVYFEKGRFHRTDHIHNKPSDKVLVAEDGSLVTDKKKIKNNISYVVMAHEGKQKSFTACKFIHGIMMDANAVSTPSIPLWKDKGVLVPMCDVNSGTKDNDFYVKGELANGRFVYPGSTKEYGFLNGKLMYIVDHANTNITYRAGTIFSYNEGKKSEAPKSTSTRVHILDLLEDSYEGVISRAVIDPITHEIWEPFLVQGDKEVRFVNTAVLVVQDNISLSHWWQLKTIKDFKGVMSKEDYEVCKVDSTVLSAIAFKEHCKKQTENVKYNSNLTFIQTAANAACKQFNYKGPAMIPDVSLTSSNVILKIKDLFESTENKVGTVEISFMTFITVYNADNVMATELTDPILGMKPYDIVDFSDGFVYRPSLVSDAKKQSLVYNFTRIGALVGDGFTRPASSNKREKLHFIHSSTKTLMNDLAFQEYCKNRLPYERYAINKELFYSYLKEHGFVVKGLLDMEDFVTNGYIYNTLASLMGRVPLAKEESISTKNITNSTIGEKKPVVDAEGNHDDIIGDGIIVADWEEEGAFTEADMLKAAEVEIDMREFIMDISPKIEEMLDKANNLVDYFTDAGAEDHRVLCEVENDLNSNSNYFQPEDEDEDEEESSDEDATIRNTIMLLLGTKAIIHKIESSKPEIQYKAVPTPTSPIDLSGKYKKELETNMAYSADLEKDDEWYCDGYIRREIEGQHFCIAKWFMIFTVKNNEVHSLGFKIHLIPEEEQSLFGVMSTVDLAYELERWTSICDENEILINKKKEPKLNL